MIINIEYDSKVRVYLRNDTNISGTLICVSSDGITLKKPVNGTLKNAFIPWKSVIYVEEI